MVVKIRVIAFGIITIGTGFIHNRSGFYAVKSLLGIAESFVLPGNSLVPASLNPSTIWLIWISIHFSYIITQVRWLLLTIYFSCSTMNPVLQTQRIQRPDRVLYFFCRSVCPSILDSLPNFKRRRRRVPFRRIRWTARLGIPPAPSHWISAHLALVVLFFEPDSAEH
jgi:hypothetical protein